MQDFLQKLIDGTPMQKGIFVMVGGMLGVFLLLILFYLLIKTILRLFPYKQEDS